MATLSHALLFSGIALLVSCGNSDSESAGTDPVPSQGFEQKSGDGFNDDSTKILGRYGATNPMFSKSGNQITGEEGNLQNDQFQGAFGKRQFAAKNYDKKAFWGQKGYAAQVYSGNTDGGRFQTAARDGGKGAQENVMTSRDSGRGFATGTHSAGAARESNSSVVQTGSDSVTDRRRAAYKQPDVINWKNQNGLTVDDTNDMLGR